MPPDGVPREETARDRVQRLVQEATEQLAEELKAGKSEGLRRYLAAMGRFHRYSWTNTLLIQSQRPTASRVAGYHRWRDLGRSVRRGEKGIVIYAPITRRADQELDLSSPQKPERREPHGFRAAYVFDIEQTEGKALPEFSRTGGEPKESLDLLKHAVAKRGIALDYDSAIGVADGLSKGGRITLRPGLAPAEEFSVLAHELAHELLHRGPDRSALSKTVRETQAEAVAFVVSRGIGLETNTAARDYIALYHGDTRTLTESLAAIKSASSEILRDLLPEERAVDRRQVSPSEPQPTRAIQLEFGDGPSQTLEQPSPQPPGGVSLDR